ncbi:MAG: class I SAM-dependent methyltransferase [Cellulosilyticaceae bacterium]
MFDRNMTLNAHIIIEGHLKSMGKENAIAIDATVGNGFDLLFLAQQATLKQIIGFDIQPQAITTSYAKIKDVKDKEIRLIAASHHLVNQFVSQPIDVAMFNLGYLPTADKEVVTCTETTLQAIDCVLNQLAEGGICTIMTYPGHAEGMKEHLAIAEFFDTHYDKNKTMFKLSIEQTKRPCPVLYVIVNRKI